MGGIDAVIRTGNPDKILVFESPRIYTWVHKIGCVRLQRSRVHMARQLPERRPTTQSILWARPHDACTYDKGGHFMVNLFLTDDSNTLLHYREATPKSMPYRWNTFKATGLFIGIALSLFLR